jgi:hypothetical protein
MAKIRAGKWEYTEAELNVQLREAERRAEESDRTQARATAVRYDSKEGRIIMDLADSRRLSIPPEKLQGLAGASPEELADVNVAPGGFALHWDRLNVGFTVPGLVAGIFGSPAWMSDLENGKGESLESMGKAKAARAYGPRVRPRDSQPSRTERGRKH